MASQETKWLDPNENFERSRQDERDKDDGSKEEKDGEHEDLLTPLMRAVFASIRASDGIGDNDTYGIESALPKHRVLSACSRGGDAGARKLLLMGLTQAIDAVQVRDERCIRLLLNPVAAADALRAWEARPSLSLFRAQRISTL